MIFPEDYETQLLDNDTDHQPFMQNPGPDFLNFRAMLQACGRPQLLQEALLMQPVLHWNAHG